MPFEILPGDTLVISVRRDTVTKDGDKEVTRSETTELSQVSVGEAMTIQGGSVVPEWDDQQRMLVIRLRT